MNDEVKFRIGDFHFSWDDRKAKANIRKHNVSFDMAAEVFLDNNAIEELDFTSSEEDRYRIIGKAAFFASPILFVVFVERYNIDNKQIIRLISAREATRKEVQKYVGRNSARSR